MTNRYTRWALRRKRAEGKGGEGSRGGHVIGHTKSGKPIYAHSDDHMKSFIHEHEDKYHAKIDKHVSEHKFNKDEHKEAAEAHLREHERQKGSRNGDIHLDIAKSHLRAANPGQNRHRW